MTENAILYCLGCGGAVARSGPGQVLAISCRCGALAPVLVSEDGASVAPPFSIIRVLRGESKPPEVSHLEYWLGYSDHESPTKTQWSDFLRKAGSTSQAECELEKCRLAYIKGRNRGVDAAGDPGRPGPG